MIDAALKTRDHTLRRVAGTNGVYNPACMWLAMVNPRVQRECAREREPLSLVLLAHWVVTLKYVKDIWWIRGWPERTVRAVWGGGGKGVWGVDGVGEGEGGDGLG
ncbi:uncharacterized protein GGS25DRAFT_526510 [Hypoxylon fragiforme]|uniref:uncharacterized protein n=1 Tax=Hypoxylon fragiforme TaxID=63214 RepID=UPI0020C62480|nr:uncharacterized protein GGS25DRAFT_526510 [Hypoxylon fragiforme]KAI2603470.1 hypothetical protein GGS25DRAFT_526510 [Hypoxylon fragiforme]